MPKIRYLRRKLYYFVFGNIYAHILYDKRYLATSYFSYPSAPGFEWAVYDWKARKLTEKNRDVPWPVAPGTDVPHPENIIFDPEEIRIFHGTGIYFQGVGAKTYIGKRCWIARNVGFITSNHDINNPTEHSVGKDIVIGDDCWIGMNAVILPGVTLGPHTTVGAGAVVTKSFPQGFCVIAGNPARVIKETS